MNAKSPNNQWKSEEFCFQNGTIGKSREEILEEAKRRMEHVMVPNQVLGQQEAIGCVSLEVTQKCNIDCSLCYLTENANSLKDLPLEELYKRIKQTRREFGKNTDIQISGGDPTLRKREDLIAVVKYARSLELNPTLMTNGIRCSRDLLEELCAAGLSDIAFHVDLTQERPGYSTEKELNAIRLEYIERTRDLPLMVVFNTTVFIENFHEIPGLVKFFIEHSDHVGFASFQLQADTGRSRLDKREVVISLESVRKQVEIGGSVSLPWDTIRVGHPQCHHYVPTFVINGKAHGIVDDKDLFGEFLKDFGHLTHDRRQGPLNIFWSYFWKMIWKPKWFFLILKTLFKKLWALKKELIAGRGKVRKLSFFIHNFMDADNLDPERIEACSFMVLTAEGPVSMCVHNADRQKYLDLNNR